KSRPSARRPLGIGDRRTRRHPVEVNAAEGGDFQRWMLTIEPGHEAEHIEFDALDHADLESKEPIEVRLEAGSASGTAKQRAVGAIILADRVRRHSDFKFGRGAQPRRHEGVAVGTWPHAIVAVFRIWIRHDGGLDLGDSGSGAGAANIGDDPWPLAQPIAI